MVSTPTITPPATANSYATVAQADAYLLDSVRAGVPWTAVPPDTKKRALLTATRLIERQRLKGVPTNDPQALHFPATGVTDKYGNALDENTVPAGIISGCIELAFELSQRAALEASGGTSDNNKRLKAGSVEIERFSPVDGTRFSTVVMELIGEFLDNGSDGLAVESHGTCDESTFDSDDTFDVSNPYA